MQELSTAPRLTTPRLLLRGPERGDLAAFTRRLAAARAGILADPAEDYGDALAAAEGLPGDMLAPYLLIARAAWAQDKNPDADHRRAAAMAKLHATEEAQKVIDAALQLHGGRGVEKGAKVEELYREIRALRIYEGASEVQRQVIGKTMVKEGR